MRQPDVSEIPLSPLWRGAAGPIGNCIKTSEPSGAQARRGDCNIGTLLRLPKAGTPTGSGSPTRVAPDNCDRVLQGVLRYLREGDELGSKVARFVVSAWPVGRIPDRLYGSIYSRPLYIITGTSQFPDICPALKSGKRAFSDCVATREIQSE